MAGKRKTATMELAIGATIIAGIIILIVMLMAWGNSTSILSRHYNLVVNMSNVGGLKEGAPVKMGGFQIGRVGSIQIQPGGTDMEIVLDIEENRLLPKGSSAKVSTAGLVGDAFMEIIPGKSAEMLRRADSVAEAERLESSAVPDMSELFVKVSDFGDQLTILTANLNDVVGDAEFRKSVKQLAVNMDAVSHQANLILQRSQKIVDNIEQASLNVVTLSDSIRENVDEITSDIAKVTDVALEIADSAKGTMDDVKEAVGTAKGVVADVKDAVGTAKQSLVTVREAVELAKTTVGKANDTIDNINGGITDARTAINNTIGSPVFADSLTSSISNINTVTSLLARRNDSLDNLITSLDALAVDLRAVAGNVKNITAGIDPSLVPNTLNTLTGSINSMTEVVETIKKEPVLALSINKAADRIVKMKFDEMHKLPQFKNSDDVLDEINRWVRASMQRGYLLDPAYPYTTRPYVMPAPAAEPTVVAAPPPKARRAQGESVRPTNKQRPYMVER